MKQKGSDSWRWQGTAFFVTSRALLTCAHVVGGAEKEYRIVWYGPSGPNEVAVEVEDRYPDLDKDTDPYPSPDVAVLKISDDTQKFEQYVAWLDVAEPGDDLWAYGYTDEYKKGQALGHPTRFQAAGPAQADANGPGRVWRIKGDRVRAGLSGSPMLDLNTGRVVGILKRTQDSSLPLGAYCVWMKDVLPYIPDVMRENESLNSDPLRNDAVAQELWGRLVAKAASALSQNPVARKELATALQLPEKELSGDEDAQARSLARKLFLLDLDQLAPVIESLAHTIGRNAAAEVFEAVVTCTAYEGEQWIAGETAAELAVQVELLATGVATVGRVLYLRTKEYMRSLYIQRANRNNTWSRHLLQCGPFSHETSQNTGVPKDLERAMRTAIIEHFPSSPDVQKLRGPTLDSASQESWEKWGPKLLSRLRKDRVIGLLPPDTHLDEQLVDRLSQDYPLVLIAVDPGMPPKLGDRSAYQALDPDVYADLADLAFLAYDHLRADLANP